MTIHCLNRESREGLAECPPEPPEPSEVQPLTEPPKMPEMAVYGLSEKVLTSLDVQPCQECCRPVVTRYAHQRLPLETRHRMHADGIRRVGTRGLCDTCWSRASAGGYLGKYTQTPRGLKSLPLRDRFDLKAEWEGILADGGHLPELAKKLNSTPEGLRGALKKIGVNPERKQRDDVIERDYLIEEVTFLVSCGLGVHEIAQKFSLTDKELISRFQYYRTQGFTLVDLQFKDTPGLQGVTEDRKAA